MQFISTQQQLIVESNAQHKLINGCAGSHKTDTLIKCAIQDLEINKRPILFLTLVGSVTVEIKERLERALNIQINKHRNTNHYVGYYNDIQICISNYDAWVDAMLRKYDIDFESEAHGEKVNILLELSEKQKLTCFNKFSTKIGLLLIDEAQDLHSKMKILVNIGLVSPSLSIYAAGDYLQTIFSDRNDNLKTFDTHAMNIFKKLRPSHFDLNICRRCPKGHVDFNNLLLKNIQKKYDTPQMESSNNNIIDKPLLFTHEKISSNTSGTIIAEQITSMIETLMEHDTTIIPSDIAIIMARSNNNEIYNQLESQLKKLFLKKGYDDAIYYMRTDADGYHNTLDWDKAKGKTVMLSIHGDKGKGHKVVFFLGLTEKSIPKEEHLYTPNEIISESLLNVGTTRSTKYLFIGFTYNYPSRYLCEYSEELGNYSYLGWDTPTMVPEPYKSIIISQQELSHTPIYDNGYIKEKIMVGSRSKLEIKNDISKDFEQTNNIISNSWRRIQNETKFGETQRIKIPFQEEQYMLLGIMSELLIQRIMNRTELFTILQNNKIIYTSDEKFLCFMYDLKDELFINDHLREYRNYLTKNPGLETKIRKAHDNKESVIHSIFNSKSFRTDLVEFLSEKVNSELRTECIWNVTLFYNQLTQKMYKPAINASYGFFTEDITTLHSNIDKYIKLELNNKKLSFEKSMSVKGKFTPDELKILKKDSHIISVNGRFDIYDETTQKLNEIKASKLNQCSHEWIIQTLMYVLMLDMYNILVKKISIVNILNGIKYEWELPTKMPKLEDIVKNKLANKYEWHEIEIKSLLHAIENERNNLKDD